MKMLFVSPWYAPEPETRVAPLAEGMVARGHEVRVLTGFPYLGVGRVYDGYGMRPWHRERRAGVELVRLPLYPDHSGRVLHRAANYLSFNAALAAIGPWMLRDADVIFAYTPIIGVPALAYRALLRAPLIIDLPDLWPEALHESGLVPEGPVVGLLGRASDTILQHADYLTLRNPGFRAPLLRRGVAGGRLGVVENWADGEVFKPRPRDPALARRFGLDGRFHVMFAGNLGYAQGLDTVLDAAALLARRGRHDIRLVLVGDGSRYDVLRERARREALDNVLFPGRHPPELMPSLFAHADALLVHLLDRELFAVTIPAKTQSYLACGRPVLMAVRGDGAELIDGSRAGLSCPPEDPPSMAAAIERMQAMEPAEREAMGARGRALFEARFTRKVLLDRMEGIFGEVAGRGRL